ncbi:MAG: enoyl-CoA hydratase/isomerase family protein [Rhodobiaceae bacterium]|nr:enoyl-CoA hydratase/isomerase family protein [Rhodobiaceae bacterium]
MITLEIKDGIAIATLSRAPVNAINEEWLDRLSQIIGEAEAAPGVSVLLIRSDQRTFCAGADLKLMASRFPSAEERKKMIAFVRRIQEVYERLERSRLVSIAEVAGAAMGGGMELALACDFRIIANEAKVGLPEVRLGLLPGAGGTQRMTRICGEAMSKRLILTAEVLDGAAAERVGLAHWSVPRAEISSFAEEFAAKVARLSPAALGFSKTCIDGAIFSGQDGYERELTGTESLFANPDTQARVRKFLEG